MLNDVSTFSSSISSSASEFVKASRSMQQQLLVGTEKALAKLLAGARPQTASETAKIVKSAAFRQLIQQQLFALWRTGWQLGHVHAASENQTSFVSNLHRIEFAKKENELEKQLRIAREATDRKENFERNYFDSEGGVKVSRYMKQEMNLKGDFTNEQKMKALERAGKQYQLLDAQAAEENDKLQALIRAQQKAPTVTQKQKTAQQQEQQQARDDVREVVENVAARQAKREVRNAVQDSLTQQSRQRVASRQNAVRAREAAKAEQQRLVGKSSLLPSQMPANKRDAIAAIQERRLLETQRTEDQGVPLLEQTRFGQLYVSSRNAYLAEEMQQLYNPALADITKDYFESGNVRKDINYYNRIAASITNPQESETQKLEQQIKLIRKKISDRPRKDEQIAAALEGITDSDEYDRRSRELERQPSNPIINLSWNEQQLLGQLNRNLTLMEARQLRDNLEQRLARINNVKHRVKRIALTEMTAAYNLGRLDEFSRRGVDYVRWNLDAEHVLRGVACDDCKKRALTPNSLGVGVYSLQNILDRNELQPPLHVNCACFLSPASDEEVERNKAKTKKVEQQELTKDLNKWAVVAGSAAILSTAVMYNVFKKSNRVASVSAAKVTQTILRQAEQQVKTAKPKAAQQIVTQAQTQIDTLLPKAVVENAEIVLPALALPLQELVLPDAVPLKIAQQPQVQQAVASTDDTFARQSQFGGTVETQVGGVLAEAIEQVNAAQASNPRNGFLQDQFGAIEARLDRYASYARNTGLSKEERQQYIRLYKQDLNLLNRTIAANKDSGADLYLAIQKAHIARDEATSLMRQKLASETIPAETTVEQLINANPKIERLNNVILDLEAAIRTNIAVNEKGGYVEQLTKLRDKLLVNPNLQEEYIQEFKKTIGAAFRRIPTEGLGNLQQRTSDIQEALVQLNKADLTLPQYRRLAKQIDEALVVLQQQQRFTKLREIGIEAEFIAATKPPYMESAVVGKAAFINDYYKGLQAVEQQLVKQQYLLEQYKRDAIVRDFTKRGSVTKDSAIAALQAELKDAVRNKADDRINTLFEKLKQTTNVEFKRRTVSRF